MNIWDYVPDQQLDNELKQKDFDFQDEFDFAIALLKQYQWMGVCSGVEGLCIECFQSPEQGHLENCLLDRYFKRINEPI